MSYILTKNAKIYKVWSDNVEEFTYSVYDSEEEFDVFSTYLEVIHYSDIITKKNNHFELEIIQKLLMKRRN